MRVSRTATTTITIARYLAVSPSCIVIKGINVNLMASARKCANMALSKPNVQNNQPNARPPMPFKINVEVTTRGFMDKPRAASVGKCAVPNARANRTLATQNTMGFGLPSESWKSNPPSHASSERPNKRKSVLP